MRRALPILLLLFACDRPTRPDAGEPDSGKRPRDASIRDVERIDLGMGDDAGPEDLGAADTGTTSEDASIDAGIDAGAPDLGLDAGVDAGFVVDAGFDAGTPDLGVDAGFDAGAPDLGVDAGPPAPAVILMIGDGMGYGQIDAASLFRHGATGRLFMQSLPKVGKLRTASLSGLTDSAASATAMATGQKTWNGNVALDRFDQPIETVIELAHKRGMAGGVVTTAALPHATPAGFSAHGTDRNNLLDLARSQALDVRPEVLLGGGSRMYFKPGPDSDRIDESMVDPLIQSGWAFVRNSIELADELPRNDRKLLGLFAAEHLDYVIDRPVGSAQPDLTTMSLAALTTLDREPKGFFLMIEGARIDMAAHVNDLERAATETLAFDDAAQAVATWARARGNVTLLVTADHETGGLAIVDPKPAGQLSGVTWERTDHTNAEVPIFGEGPGAERFDGALLDNRWVHSAIAARLTGAPIEAPSPGVVVDGVMEGALATEQTNESGYGPGFNRLDRMYVSSDRDQLVIGLEGLFERGKNAVLVLIDVDLGAGTGPSAIRGATSDTSGKLDAIIAALPFDAPAAAGFGVDFVAGNFGASWQRAEDLIDEAGLRGIHAPNGAPGDLAWQRVSTNFGEGVRTSTTSPVVPGEGFEIAIPWASLYPSGLPRNAVLGLAAVLVNDDGGHASNQVLPPFPIGTMNPGRTATALPGVVSFPVDPDGDGVADAPGAPAVLP